MELKYDPREIIKSLHNRLAEVVEERNLVEWERDRLKEEITELKEALHTYKGLWIEGESTISFLRKELYEAHRDLEVAQLRLQVMQLEESNARLRESKEEV